MPITPTYPGVYIEEVPSAVRAITGVATSVCAFLGRARRGPANEAVVINSLADFDSRFGGLWSESTMSYAVRDFFLNGGGQAVIVRLFRPLFETEGKRTEALEAAAKVADAATTSSGVAGATPDDVVTAAADAAGEVTDEPGSAAAKAVLAAVKKAAGVADATAAEVAEAGAAAAEGVAPEAFAELTVGGLKLRAAEPGAWGNRLRARVDRDTIGDDAGRRFNLLVFDGVTGQIETFLQVGFEEDDPRRVNWVLENESRLIRAPDLPATRPTASGDTPDGADQWDPTTWGDSPPDPPPSAGVADADTASDGMAVEDDDYISGLPVLERADIFNLLCLPPPTRDVDIEQETWDEAAAYCRRRRAFLIVDPPSGWKAVQTALDKLENVVPGANRDHAALFFPRISRPDPERADVLTEFVPCGAVAGVFARTDADRGVWKAPAGLDAGLVNAPALTVPLSDAECGQLNPKAVNCLRPVPAAGRVVWGARTLAGDDRLASQWKYIPVRRLALFIEESLYRGTHWVVFEPNDEPLWASIRLNVGAFMHRLFRQGAFQGSTPQQAYLVKVDGETTTQADIDIGIVNIHVGFAPLKPAEFVIIKIRQLAGQSASQG